MKLNGTFQITNWQEDTEHTFEQGGKSTLATVSQSYQGDIQGDSTVHYRMHYTADGNASFNGFEYLQATIDGLAYQLTLKHDGEFKAGVASSKFVVVDCHPAGVAPGLQGEFVASMHGQADYKLG